MFNPKSLFNGLFILASLLTIGACDQTKRYTDQESVQRAKDFQAEGQLESAVVELKNALQNNPQNLDARLRLGEIYAQQGLGEPAELELKKTKELGMDDEVLKVPLGQALLLQGLYQRVAAEIQLTPKSPPENIAKILEIQGRAQVGLLHFEDGCKLFAQSQEKDPQYVPSYWGLARCAAARRNLDEARAEIAKALKLDEKNNGTWTLLGDLERAAKRLPDAEAAYTTALAHKRNDLDALLGRAIARIETNKLDEANRDIDAAFRISKRNLTATQLRGVSQFKQGKLTEAKTSFETVLNTNPNYVSALLWLGLTNLSLKNYEQAAKQFAQFNRGVPNVIEIQALLALAQSKMGAKTEARETLRVLSNVNIEDPQSLATLAQAYMSVGEADLAAAYFSKAIEKKPEAANLRLGLATTLLQKGDSAQGITQLEKAVELDPGMTGADMLLVRNYIQSKQYDKALQQIVALELKHPKNSTIFNLKGAALLGKKDYTGARASFEQALALEPPSVAAAQNLAQMDLLEKKPEVARQRFEAILAKDKSNVQAMLGLARLAAATAQETEYVSWLERAAKTAPSLVGPRISLANYYLRKKKIQSALAMAQEAQTVSPDNPQVLELLGTIQLAAGERENAVATYRKLTNLLPESAVAHYMLAMAQTATQNANAARISLNRALALAPNYLDAEILLASVELGAGQAGKTLKIAHEIQKQHPDSPVGSGLEGDALMAQKQYALAVKAYGKAFGIQKNGLLIIKLHQALSAAGNSKEADARVLQWLKDEPKDSITRSYLAATYIKAGQNKRAIEQLQLILENDPKNVAALNDLALLYQQEKDPRALTTAEQAYALRPNDAHIMDTLGWILVGQDNASRSMELLQRAVAQAPTSTGIRYHWAVALAKFGDKAQARNELRSLLEENKNFPQRAATQALLKEL